MKLNTIFLGVYDILITPLYFSIFIIAIYIISRNFKDLILGRVFFWGLTFKAIAAIIFGVVYDFYYGGGDTSAYWLYGTYIGDSFWESPVVWLKLLSHADLDSSIYKYACKIVWYNDSGSYFPCRIVGFLAPFCFNIYTTIAIFFAAINFSGLWVLYKTLRKKYYQFDKELIVAIFCIPSIVFWGSGILKDGITLSALGWLFYGFYEFFIQKEKKVFYILIIFIASWVLIIIKMYIILCFLPCIIIWLMLSFFKEIHNKVLRRLLYPLFFAFVLTISIFATKVLSEYSKSYSFDNIVKTSKSTSAYIQYVSEVNGGATYNIGVLDFTLTGILKMIPLAINVSLFRPYIWESGNLFILFSALENSVLILLICQIIFKGGASVLKMINEDLFVIFCILFSFSFAFAIGISTNNFGALVRYKIPILPFFVFMLLLLRKKILLEQKRIKDKSTNFRIPS